MALQVARQGSSLERYISDVRSVWRDGKDPRLPFNVKALMENLFASTGPDDPWMAKLIRQGKPATELYRDPDFGFIQMGHIHHEGQGNRPHDHGPCWVVYGSYQGVTEIATYRRTDDGKVPGAARLDKIDVQRLPPGVVRPYFAGEIHSTNTVQGPGVVFRFLSADLNKVERYRYNLEQGTVARV